MDIKIGEQPNINISLTPSPKINIEFEAKYIGGGNFVESSQVKHMVALTESQYNNLAQSGKVQDDTFYIVYDEE